MDTLTIIIIGVAVLLVFDALLILHIRKKPRNTFKMIIEKGVIVKNEGDIPSEFLYDVQQLVRMYKPENVIIYATEINTSEPKLEFRGGIEPELQLKIERALQLSIQ